MIKTVKINNLDCAHCALKIENEIKKLEQVEKATVSVIMQKITINAPAEAMDDILKQVVKIANKVEPDCEVLI